MNWDLMVYDNEAVVSVTKEFTFDSAHFLNKYEGKCANLHGHTYKLQVTVSGKLNKQGMVIDFNELKEIINKKIVAIFDHKVINEVFPYNPTAENMTIYFFEVIKEYLEKNYKNKIFVERVRLYETPTSYVEYKGVYNNAIC